MSHVSLVADVEKCIMKVSEIFCLHDHIFRDIWCKIDFSSMAALICILRGRREGGKNEDELESDDFSESDGEC